MRLCKRKGEASYYEAKLLFETDAIMRDDFYNTWLTLRVRNSHLK